MQGWFARNMPSVKIVIKRMSSGPFGDDAGLRKEIVDKKIDGVITGIAG
jgi:methylglyoxal synthase